MIDLSRVGFFGVVMLIAFAAWGGWYIGRDQERELRIQNLERANGAMAACLVEIQRTNESIDGYLGQP